jgi:hypothetical protein
MAYRNTRELPDDGRWPQINPDSSGFIPRMPSVVVMGVDAVGQLKQAAKPSAGAQRWVPFNSAHSSTSSTSKSRRILMLAPSDLILFAPDTMRSQLLVMLSVCARMVHACALFHSMSCWRCYSSMLTSFAMHYSNGVTAA